MMRRSRRRRQLELIEFTTKIGLQNLLVAHALLQMFEVLVRKMKKRSHPIQVFMQSPNALLYYATKSRCIMNIMQPFLVA